MSPTLRISLRFFTEHKRAMALSAGGVIFGVAFFIAAQAQTTGFQKFYIQTTLGSSGSIIVSDRFQASYSNLMEKQGGVVNVSNPQSRKYYEGIADAYRIIRVLGTFPNVAACSPVIEDRAFLRSNFRSEAVVVDGIDLDLHLKTTALGEQVVAGNIDDFRNDPSAIALGAALAEKMELKVGQNIFLTGSNGTESRRFKITTIYQTGINAIDEKRIYVHRRAAQTTLGLPFTTSQIIVKLRNPMRAREDAKAFEDLLSHRSRAWQEREKGNLQMLSILRLSAAVTVSTIILLAGFGIFNVLTMSVLEKTKEIAILRSMGYTRRDITAIFLWQGTGIAVIGIALGWLGGVLLTFGISKVPIKLRGVIRADYLVVNWDFSHYLIAAGLAIIAVLIAAYTPARRAAGMDPVNILRGSSQ